MANQSLYNLDPSAIDDLYLACHQALGFVRSWEKSRGIAEPTLTRKALEAAIEQATPWSE